MFTVGLLLAFLTHRIAYWRNKYAMYVFSSHYSDVIISAMASQITGISIVYSIVCSGSDHIKHQRSASLTFVRGIHRWPVNSPHKGPVKRKCFHLMMSLWYTIHRCWNWTAYQTIEWATDSTPISNWIWIWEGCTFHIINPCSIFTSGDAVSKIGM